jgi:alkylhydroperoxidase family enzyme
VAYIKQIGEHEATGLIKKVYEAAIARAGGVARIIQVMSRHDRSAEASLHLYSSLMKSPNSLTAAQREMLATVVSNANACYY